MRANVLVDSQNLVQRRRVRHHQPELRVSTRGQQTHQKKVILVQVRRL